MSLGDLGVGGARIPCPARANKERMHGIVNTSRNLRANVNRVAYTVGANEKRIAYTAGVNKNRVAYTAGVNNKRMQGLTNIE